MQGTTETRVGLFVLAALAVFVYMGFHIGAFRFDRDSYNLFTMSFKDISGLSRKADVKIAGVKVGWVEDVKLLEDGELQAEAQVMVNKEYALYADAYAIVRQDGLLGPKYIELIPGDPLMKKMHPGDTLRKPSIEPVSIDEILKKFNDIATNVQEVTDSFRDAVGGAEGKENLRAIFENLNITAERMTSFSAVLDRSITRNEENIDAFLEIGQHVRRLSDKLESTVFPSLQEGIDRISGVFDRDFDRLTDRIDSTASALEEASIQARDGLRSIGSIAEKIDEGKGLLGKIVNEDETYRDLRVAIQGLKNYVTQIDRLQVIFDAHFESMHRPAENYIHEDSKGYFDMRIHPNQDHFYVLQLATSEKGFIDRYEVHRSYACEDENWLNTGDKIDTNTLNLTDAERLHYVYRKKKEYFNRNTLKLGLQFGKIFNNVAFRFGLFEGSAGLAADVDIPFPTDRFRWVTTLECFDMAGWNRKDDRRPHFKWLNKMYFMRNLYFTFGADDFVSKRNANAFLGAGLRFGDDDVKYLLSSIGGASTGVSAVH